MRNSTIFSFEVKDNMAVLPEFSLGEPLEPVLFLYGHWAVTTYGVEHVSGTYSFEGCRVFESDWLNHMAEKNWVNIDDFGKALNKAREVFNRSGYLTGDYRKAKNYTLAEIVLGA